MFIEFLSNGKPLVVNTNQIVCMEPGEEDNRAYIQTTMPELIIVDLSYDYLRDWLFNIDEFDW